MLNIHRFHPPLVLSAQWVAAGPRASASVVLRRGFDGHQLGTSLLCLLHLLGGPGQPPGRTVAAQLAVCIRSLPCCLLRAFPLSCRKLAPARQTRRTRSRPWSSRLRSSPRRAWCWFPDWITRRCTGCDTHSAFPTKQHVGVPADLVSFP